MRNVVVCSLAEGHTALTGVYETAKPAWFRKMRSGDGMSLLSYVSGGVCASVGMIVRQRVLRCRIEHVVVVYFHDLVLNILSKRAIHVPVFLKARCNGRDLGRCPSCICSTDGCSCDSTLRRVIICMRS